MSPAAQPAGEAPEDRLRVGGHGVEAAPRPADQAQVRAHQRRFEQRVAQPRGRAEELGDFAGDRADAVLGAPDLLRDRRRAKEREAHGVVLGVVLQAVALREDLARERRILPHALADAEERGTRAGGGQEREHRGGDLRIRAIIDGEGDHRRARRLGQVRPVRAQERAARPQSRRGDEQLIGHDRAEGPGPRPRARDHGRRRRDMQHHRGAQQRARREASRCDRLRRGGQGGHPENCPRVGATSASRVRPARCRPPRARAPPREPGDARQSDPRGRVPDAAAAQRCGA